MPNACNRNFDHIQLEILSLEMISTQKERKNQFKIRYDPDKMQNQNLINLRFN